MKPEVHRIRVNVKSLAAEARIIRQEIRRARDPFVKSNLDYHRRSRVKPEARLAHLALAYVKGVPYKVAEANCKEAPPAAQLYRKIERFAGGVTEGKVKEWLTQ